MERTEHSTLLPRGHQERGMASRAVLLLLCVGRVWAVSVGSAAAAWGTAIGAVHHLLEPPRTLRTSAALEQLANTRIAGPDANDILAYVARPPAAPDGEELPVLVMIHEFFGLSDSIAAKARLFAKELNCLVIAPDTFRGVTTSFIPQAIWLALSTPQDRVNRDLDAVIEWAGSAAGADVTRVAVLGFCYGGGKAIRYTTQVRPGAATVVYYGTPLTSSSDVASLRAPVCGVFGANDVQIPPPAVNAFRDALSEAQIEHEVVSYAGVGHAFFSDVRQVEREEMPVVAAYKQSTDFLRRFFSSGTAGSGEGGK